MKRALRSCYMEWVWLGVQRALFATNSEANSVTCPEHIGLGGHSYIELVDLVGNARAIPSISAVSDRRALLMFLMKRSRISVFLRGMGGDSAFPGTIR